MKRILLNELLEWKASPERKPLLLDGARQVGKSWLIQRLFGEANFAQVITLDFLLDRNLASLFEASLEPQTLISNIELALNCRINPATDLLFFDEVGECQRAVDSLKYFAERMPEAFVCASGSNIGLLDSFPVGKVYYLELYPFTFEEFLIAGNNAALADAYQAQARQQFVHDQLWGQLLDYYFVGGMPEAVAAWHTSDKKINRVERVSKIHGDLINGYLRDFGKYSGKVNAQHIEAVFRAVPVQLFKNMDDSVKRFVFNDVVPAKRRYAELRGPIDWLEKTRLVSKCFPIDCKPTVPLSALKRDNIFKLFLFDVGLLGHMLGMSYQDQQNQRAAYKGYIAENFVQNEWRAGGASPTYAWEEARGQIEFLHKTEGGDVIPVEVKSGAKTRAKSLQSYIDRYQPTKTVKLIGSAGGNRDQDKVVWPLYYARNVLDL